MSEPKDAIVGVRDHRIAREWTVGSVEERVGCFDRISMNTGPVLSRYPGVSADGEREEDEAWPLLSTLNPAPRGSWSLDRWHDFRECKVQTMPRTYAGMPAEAANVYLER